MRTKGSAGVWGLIILLAVISAVVGWMRLAGLPELGMLLGPDLTVRSVAVEGGPTIDGQPVQRGDRLTAVAAADTWMSTGDLRELAQVLPLLVPHAEAPVAELAEEESDPVALRHEDGAVLDYQLHRPVHRFSLVLEGEGLDPTGLPAGVEAGDRLVEIDGKQLREAWGPEGIRSVAANRPDAALGIERPNVFFFGQLWVDDSGHGPGILLSFLLVLLGIAALWRWHSEEVGAAAAYLIGLETVCLGWLFFLVFGFQWVLADYLLASAVIIGLVMIRPLGIWARQWVGDNDQVGGTVAMGIGAVVSAALTSLMVVGYLPSPEEAIHAAALVAGLFIIYELTSSGLERGSTLGLGERGGYLAGVVGLALFAALVAALMEPVVFEEDRWRWFAVLIPSLVWFGDVTYAIKYGAHSAIGQVAHRQARQDVVWRYLREMALAMPHTDLRLVVGVGYRSVELVCRQSDLRVGPASEALADAVDILLTEGGRIPLPEGSERQVHPMGGIAKAMNISIAVALSTPSGALELGEIGYDVVLVGMRQSGEGDIPSYASVETLDQAQQLWSGAAASAAIIEALTVDLGQRPMSAGSMPAAEDVKEELAQTKEQAQACEEARQALAEERDELAARSELVTRQVKMRQVALQAVYPAAEIQAQLVEPELVEGLKYLLEEATPVALGGAVGTGKGFVAHLAHGLEGGEDAACLVVDMGRVDGAQMLDEILGQAGGGQGPGLLAGYEGTLFIRGAQRCGDGQLLTLCHQCEEEDIRLFLGFEAADAETRSVLEGRAPSLQELLGHREMIIPELVHRPQVIARALDYWLAEWADRYEKGVEGFSRMAMEALEAYDYPGQMTELVEVVRLAVVDAEYDVVDRENLPLRVREAMPL